MLPGSGRSTFITVLALVWIPQLRGASGSSEGLNVGLSYWLLFGLFQGISHGQAENQDRRIFNQGIQRSFRNSGLMGIVGGRAILISGILNIGVGIETALGPNTFGLRIDLSVGPSVAISFGQLSGLRFFGPGIGPTCGLSYW